MYKQALTKSGFNGDTIYTPVVQSNNSERENTRKRKIIWFHPPYSMNMETNIGKTFSKLVKKHFLRNNSFHKILKKNTIKISYCCLRNISSIIALHNKSVLRPKAKEYGCNCRNKESCPLQIQCLTPKVIFEGAVVNNSDDEKRVYFGASNASFKERYRNHIQDFNHERYFKCTALSKYIWQLKRNKKIFSIEWKIVSKVYCDAKRNYCLLSLKEKYFIINYSHEDILLNKRSELISKCIHENKNMLASIETNGKINNDSMD